MMGDGFRYDWIPKVVLELFDTEFHLVSLDRPSTNVGVNKVKSLGKCQSRGIKILEVSKNFIPFSWTCHLFAHMDSQKCQFS